MACTRSGACGRIFHGQLYSPRPVTLDVLPINVMKPDPQPLPFPEAFSGPWFWVIDVNLPRSEFEKLLGPRHVMQPEEGTGDADWWAFCYPCGLQLLYSVNHDNDLGAVCANLPEPEHVVRHIPFAKPDYSVPAQSDTAPHHEYTLRQFRETFPELNHLHGYQVWRMGDDGNEVKIGFPTSETDAECMVAEFESHKHKQIYWVSRCVIGPT
ncbi:MAG: hypothetical protein Aurels2KO_57960 [Aureliella sp.]